MGSSLTTRAAAIGMALAVATPSARAEDPARTRALQLFEESAAAYQAGDLELAAGLLEQAHALDPDPTLLYNLARTYEGLGKLERAVEAYRKYLHEQPTTPDRGAIETRLRTLEGQLAEHRRLREAAQRRKDQHREVPPRSVPAAAPRATVPWILAGSGIALLLVGGGFGVLAQSEHQEAQDEPTFRGAQAADERARTYALVANVLFAVGGVSAASGATWITVDLLTRPDHPAMGSLWVRGVF